MYTNTKNAKYLSFILKMHTLFILGNSDLNPSPDIQIVNTMYRLRLIYAKKCIDYGNKQFELRVYENKDSCSDGSRREGLIQEISKNRGCGSSCTCFNVFENLFCDYSTLRQLLFSKK